ncbi:hypothetical protein Ddc_15295 [Ditylenchus destructor]|nr:hypothetical protein Ddc_15295 [Ditylenchus destructor]
MDLKRDFFTLPRRQSKETTYFRALVSQGSQWSARAKLKALNGRWLAMIKSRSRMIPQQVLSSFPRFEIRGVPDEALLKFLRRAKKNFINCRLSFTDRAVSDEEFVWKVRELLTDTFLDAGEIRITTLHNNMPAYDGPERFFDTYGVQNCDKVAAWYRYDSQAKESFKEWLSWKRDQPGSRRHLVLFHYTHSVELVADLKQTERRKLVILPFTR